MTEHEELALAVSRDRLRSSTPWSAPFLNLTVWVAQCPLCWEAYTFAGPRSKLDKYAASKESLYGHLLRSHSYQELLAALV
jgi:hypothetical protein